MREAERQHQSMCLATVNARGDSNGDPERVKLVHTNLARHS